MRKIILSSFALSSLWFLPLAIDILLTYKVNNSYNNYLSPSPVEIYQWLGGFYIIVSIAIIIVTLLYKKFGKNKPPKVSSRRQKVIFWSLWTFYVVIIIGAHFFD